MNAHIKHIAKIYIRFIASNFINKVRKKQTENKNTKKREQLPAAPACLQDLRPELHHLLSWDCNHLAGIEAHCTPWLPLLYHK